MNLKKSFFLSIIILMLCSSASFGLIKLDDEGIDLAIKYGLKSKELSTRDILDSNWINDGTGRILNIYSPFIQVAVKTSDQNATENIDEDIKKIKKRLDAKIEKIINRNEIRFIISIYGDNEEFARNYKAYIVDINDYNNNDYTKKLIKPKKTSIQKIAEKDDFNPNHPFSAINCYTFKFNNLFKLKEYFFIVVSEDEKLEVKYRIDNNKIF